MRNAAWRAVAALAIILCVSGNLGASVQFSGPRFEVRFPANVHSDLITGRVFVFITRDSSVEPRFQSGARTAQSVGAPFFGVDVNQLKPDEPAIIDNSTLGYPPSSLLDIPAGDYFVQALINVYTEFHRSDGHTIWAHMDQWEGQKFDISPGNLYSEVKKVHLDPAGYTVRLNVTKTIPPVQVPADTEWVRRIKIQSPMLSKFWGRPIYVGAVVLLPKDYDKHPDVSYPVVYEQEHFHLEPPYGFRIEPPDVAVGSAIGKLQANGHEFYKDWSSEDFPRMIMVIMLHPTPYYDDSYAVNSANNGPYSDAIMQELVPYIESQFRVIRKPFARILVGGSTGGWEALALQVYHPEFFGGSWVYYPDPIDFRRWGLTDIYQEDSAFYATRLANEPMGFYTTRFANEKSGLSEWHPLMRPFMRLPDGQPVVTQKEENQLEAVLGTKCRSGDQTDVWFATYGPVGVDGYPRPLWDKLTGKIDREVAQYMRDNGYDLRYYLESNWGRIGPHIVGKLHFYVGDMDHYFLNGAVYLMEDFLKTTKNPYFGGSFEYGRPMKGHTRPTTVGDMLRWISVEVTKNAPADQDCAPWKYH
jgi:hypothetical protein